MENKKKYCSSCKHSKYETNGKGEKMLVCALRHALHMTPFLPTNCRAAEECLEYNPERWQDSLTNRHNYVCTMSKCGIPLREEKGGVLRSVTLLN